MSECALLILFGLLVGVNVYTVLYLIVGIHDDIKTIREECFLMVSEFQATNNRVLNGWREALELLGVKVEGDETDE